MDAESVRSERKGVNQKKLAVLAHFFRTAQQERRGRERLEGYRRTEVQLYIHARSAINLTSGSENCTWLSVGDKSRYHAI
jgi:hypothetical protein